MMRTPTERLRAALLALGVFLGLSGIWILVPELLSSKVSGLPFDRNGAEAAGAQRSPALLAAELGILRGDLWANAAFTGARFLWTDRAAALDPVDLKQLAEIRTETETSLALAPIDGAAWLFLAKLPAVSPEAESRVGTLLEMSYFTAPSAPELASPRIHRAATSNALADRDIQTFVRSDLRQILELGPASQAVIIDAYRDASLQNQPVFESLVADVDPAMAQLLRPGALK